MNRPRVVTLTCVLSVTVLELAYIFVTGDDGVALATSVTAVAALGGAWWGAKEALRGSP